VPPVLLPTAVERLEKILARLTPEAQRRPSADAAASWRSRCVADGCVRRHVAPSVSAGLSRPVAPARAHGGSTRSATRGRGLMSAEALSGARCVQMQGPACMRAGADAPDGARCQGLMAYDSAAISAEVYDSMGSAWTR
jgi:hypothetical protein